MSEAERVAAGFWAPYSGFQDASLRLSRFTDRALGRSCGVTYSDGESLAIVRKPASTQPGGDLWLNFLREHIALPRPQTTPAPLGRLARLERFFIRAMEVVGEGQIAQAQAQMAASQALAQVAHDDVWVPAHEFLLRHKLIADGAGVALDVLGVVAGVAFVIVAAPEIAGGAVLIGTVGLITGAAAATGSLVLLAADGTVFGFELAGDDAIARKIEDNNVVQWSRIVGTVMILPDIAVGGPRALKEIAALSAEAREAAAGARGADAAAEAQRLRVGKIHNPERHPGPVQRHVARANKLARQAERLRDRVDEARGRIRLLLARDVSASFVGSPGTAVLVGGAPPGVMLSLERLERDEKLLDLLNPEGGMPRDTKLEIRVSGVDDDSGDE